MKTVFDILEKGKVTHQKNTYTIDCESVKLLHGLPRQIQHNKD